MVLGKLQLPVLLIWIRVWHGPTALAIGVGGVVSTFFLSSFISLYSLPFSGRRGGRVVRWSRGILQLDDNRARANCACSRYGWEVVRTFLLSSIISLLFLPLN